MPRGRPKKRNGRRFTTLTAPRSIVQELMMRRYQNGYDAAHEVLEELLGLRRKRVE